MRLPHLCLMLCFGCFSTSPVVPLLEQAASYKRGAVALQRTNLGPSGSRDLFLHGGTRTLPATLAGEPGAIACNARYLLDALGALTSETVKLSVDHSLAEMAVTEGRDVWLVYPCKPPARTPCPRLVPVVPPLASGHLTNECALWFGCHKRTSFGDATC